MAHERTVMRQGGNSALHAATPTPKEKEEEALVMTGIRRATAEKLQPRAFAKDVKPVTGLVDVDAAEVAAKAVQRVVAKLEEAFRLLCERMQVNEYLLALEKAGAEEEAEEDFHDMIISPLPGGRQPAEVVREGTTPLKIAERERLLRLAQDAEASADAVAVRVGQIEAALASRLREVTATQQALTEIRDNSNSIGKDKPRKARKASETTRQKNNVGERTTACSAPSSSHSQQLSCPDRHQKNRSNVEGKRKTRVNTATMDERKPFSKVSVNKKALNPAVRQQQQQSSRRINAQDRGRPQSASAFVHRGDGLQITTHGAQNLRIRPLARGRSNAGLPSKQQPSSEPIPSWGWNGSMSCDDLALGLIDTDMYRMQREAAPFDRHAAKAPSCLEFKARHRRPSPRPTSATSARLFVPRTSGPTTNDSAPVGITISIEKQNTTQSKSCSNSNTIKIPQGSNSNTNESGRRSYTFGMNHAIHRSGPDRIAKARTTNDWNSSTQIDMDDLPSDALLRKHPGWVDQRRNTFLSSPFTNHLTGWAVEHNQKGERPLAGGREVHEDHGGVVDGPTRIPNVMVDGRHRGRGRDFFLGGSTARTITTRTDSSRSPGKEPRTAI